MWRPFCLLLLELTPVLMFDVGVHPLQHALLCKLIWHVGCELQQLSNSFCIAQMICSNEPTCMIICKVHARINSMRVTDCNQMDVSTLVSTFIPKSCGNASCAILRIKPNMITNLHDYITNPQTSAVLYKSIGNHNLFVGLMS